MRTRRYHPAFIIKSDTDLQGFTAPLLIPPGGEDTIGPISYRPLSEGMDYANLVVRNNFTGIEIMSLEVGTIFHTPHNIQRGRTIHGSSILSFPFLNSFFSFCLPPSQARGVRAKLEFKHRHKNIKSKKKKERYSWTTLDAIDFTLERTLASYGVRMEGGRYVHRLSHPSMQAVIKRNRMLSLLPLTVWLSDVTDWLGLTDRGAYARTCDIPLDFPTIYSRTFYMVNTGTGMWAHGTVNTCASE